MDSPLPPQGDGENHISQDEIKSSAPEETDMNNMQRHPHANSRTPEPQVDRQASNSDPPDTPGTLEPFDWDEFETRYEAALRDADEQEREILKEADALSKYFKVWAAAASAHDDERAAKRLQTRRRFVNLAEDRMERKQEHYDQVVRAFENALALLRSQTRLLPISTNRKLQILLTSRWKAIPRHAATKQWKYNKCAWNTQYFSHSPSQDHPQNDAVDDTWVEEDDDLGYYSDGVKRTLTDEQIEIFRHSELEALRKEKEKARQPPAKEVVSPDETMDLSDDSPAPAPADKPSTLPTSFQSNKKRKKKGSKRPRPEPKPDLRKRTWDVVEKGLDSLDYD
ncbi:hypothetical protein F53441_11407 [Fusarium austroafricanum]|uniref:Uncharacterized protein n=1 Tax=Fusarium austroafricanum TaxID=2364996 RepID=A0A8H4NZU5_9HYPO|nr:hypothetical protein F53441_11407 [Fusarium austroafricanum]